MAKIYIVERIGTIYDYGEGEDGKDIDILKAFKSRDEAKNFVNHCYDEHVKIMKATNVDIIYQTIDDDLACIYWNKSGTQTSGILDYVILERELAE